MPRSSFPLPRRAVARPEVALLLAAASLWAVAPLARGVGEAGVGGRWLAQFFICFASGSSSRPDALAGRPGPRDDRSACVLCQAFCSGVAPLAGQPGLVGAAPVPSFVLAGTVADRVAPTPRRALSHRPRAPPA